MNLNSDKYKDKKLITKQLLLNEITDLDIYNRYMDGQPVIFNSAIKSPLMKDNNPSFGFFTSNSNEILFNDFRLGGGDCITFVKMKYRHLNLNYNEVLSKIAYDFNLENKFICKKINTNNKVEHKIKQNKTEILKNKTNFILNKRSREWSLHDIKYWKDYGISLKTLEKYNVTPIDYIFINDKIIKADKFAYCFTEFKDNKLTYKIYQPYNTKFKWLTNHNDTIWQGWSQLPKEGTDLIITKSLKDVMAIYENLGLPSISLQAESVNPKDKIIFELQKRFFNIYLLYDNDFDKDSNWGQIYADKLINIYNFDNILIPSNYKCKDYSDLIKKFGKNKATSIIKKIIHNILPF